MNHSFSKKFKSHFQDLFIVKLMQNTKEPNSSDLEATELVAAVWLVTSDNKHLYKQRGNLANSGLDTEFETVKSDFRHITLVAIITLPPVTYNEAQFKQ